MIKNSCIKQSICLLAILPLAALADNAVLLSLNSQGVQPVPLSDTEMGSIRGASILVGQPGPSAPQGLRNYHVSWKGFGSQMDYRQYRHLGDEWNPHTIGRYVYEGTEYYVSGDSWLADLSGDPYQWSAANSIKIEHHLRILDDDTLAPTNRAIRETSWNRPITTFRW